MVVGKLLSCTALPKLSATVELPAALVSISPHPTANLRQVVEQLLNQGHLGMLQLMVTTLYRIFYRLNVAGAVLRNTLVIIHKFVKSVSH